MSVFQHEPTELPPDVLQGLRSELAVRERRVASQEDLIRFLRKERRQKVAILRLRDHTNSNAPLIRKQIAREYNNHIRTALHMLREQKMELEGMRMLVQSHEPVYTEQRGQA